MLVTLRVTIPRVEREGCTRPVKLTTTEKYGRGTMISGAILSERSRPTIGNCLWNHPGWTALLLIGIAALTAGVWLAIASGFRLHHLALPAFGSLMVALAVWRLVLVMYVIPRQTIVWFQYDERRCDYRLFGDEATHSLRPLDILRIVTTTNCSGEIVRYEIRLAGGRRLLLERGTTVCADRLAEQLAADIANSPRWMFS